MYLSRYLSHTATTIAVHFHKNKVIQEVNMKIDKGTKRAMITSDWMTVVSGCNLKKGDIVMFWFRRSRANGVKLMVDKLLPGAFGMGTDYHMMKLEDHECC